MLSYKFFAKYSPVSSTSQVSPEPRHSSLTRVDSRDVATTALVTRHIDHEGD